MMAAEVGRQGLTSTAPWCRRGAAAWSSSIGVGCAAGADTRRPCC